MKPNPAVYTGSPALGALNRNKNLRNFHSGQSMYWYWYWTGIAFIGALRVSKLHNSVSS